MTFAPRQVLLPTAAFTSPSESRAGTGPGLRRVRMFGPETLVKGVARRGWDRLRLVCSQPYCQVTGRGLGGAGGAWEGIWEDWEGIGRRFREAGRS